MTRSNAYGRLAAAGAAQGNQNRGVTNIILVHGAWADGSSWSKVIPLLEAKGLNVVAVQMLAQPNAVAAFIRRAARGDQ